MKRVSLSFVLKRLLTDPAFFQAARTKLDTALSVCEYQMTRKDRDYVAKLLGTTLDRWPTKTMGDLIESIHEVNVTTPGSFEPYPETVSFLPGLVGPFWILTVHSEIAPRIAVKKEAPKKAAPKRK